MALSKKNVALLGVVISAMGNAAAPYHLATEKEVAELVKENLVETNAEISDGDKIAVRATDAGQAAYTAATAPAAAPTNTGNATTMNTFVTGKGFVPSAVRGGKGRNLYDFDGLEVGGFIFVPKTDAKPNPAKSLASTVSSATKRFAEPTGNTVTNRKGNTVPELRETRKFGVQSVENGKVYGEFTAPSDGAVIYRSA